MLGASATLVAFARSASAEPRFQVDQFGDFALIGNTLGYDCGNGTPAPEVGTVTCGGGNVSDSSPDVFWRADEPTSGSATANSSVTASDARSTAVLALPAGAVVTYARLYWAAMRSGAGADASVLIERPGTFSEALTADAVHTIELSGSLTQYESSAEVTDLVRLYGDGAYRVGDVDSIALSNLNDGRAFAAWSMVVIYEDLNEPLRQLSIFDSLVSATGGGVSVDITGFLVPQNTPDAKIGIVAYGGDGQTGGDTLKFNGALLTDGLDGGSTNNFFNASRTVNGLPVSVAGDLPKLSGNLRSMSGVDLDVVDVSAQMTEGDTAANIEVKAGGDGNVLLGVLCTSIKTYKPNFNDSLKSAVDLNGGALVAGDQIEYTINVVNTGNDPALGVVLTDEIPAGFTYVPNSIRVITDGLEEAMTDGPGDDEAEFDAGMNLVRVRLGEGADEADGGTIGINEFQVVTFRVTVDEGTTGVVPNRAKITATGESGAPETEYESDDGTGGGPTEVVVDACSDDGDCPSQHCYDPPGGGQPNECVECVDDADCSGTTPICNTQDHSCEPCSSGSECESKDAQHPACQTSGGQDGACTECSDDNNDLCTGTKPECLSNGTCGCSSTDGDSECGDSDSGMICSGPAGQCVEGCSTAPGRNGCPAGEICSKQDGSVGTCIGEPCDDNDDCTSASAPVCDTSVQPHECVQCLADEDCADPLICNGSNQCVECFTGRLENCSAAGNGAICLNDDTCGCADDSDCGAADSGRACDDATSKCVVGCRGTGNGCAGDLVCTSSDDTLGTCVECTAEDGCNGGEVCDTGDSTPTCVECLDDGDCDDGVCDESTNTCVGCADDDDCPSPKVCDTDAEACVDCTSDADCPSPSVCSSMQTCIGCTEDDECPTGQVCDEPEQTCVGCTKTSDCDGGMVCDTDTQTCVGCTKTSDCDGGMVCDTDAQTCVGCTKTSDCDGGMVCDTDAQTCVGCTSDDDCATGLTCDTEQQECVAPNTFKSSIEGGGCGCRVPGSSRASHAPLALLGLALLFARRRRSARRAA